MGWVKIKNVYFIYLFTIIKNNYSNLYSNIQSNIIPNKMNEQTGNGSTNEEIIAN